jgi:hypothetical protein
MKRPSIIFAIFSVFVFQGAVSAQVSSPILPQQFAGWQVMGSPQFSKNATVADPVNAALLSEYGFSDFESAVYTRNDGRKLTVHAARFGDATGAYGAFTYYREPQMLREEIPDQGSSLNERVLFYRGNIIVDAVFDKLSAMSAAELRDLSSDLPVAQGSAAELPAVPTYLPKKSYVRNSAKYVVGPIGLNKIGVLMSADAVNFKNGAEVALGKYNTSAGEATLVLISYPTPQIAADQLRNINGAHAANTSAQTPASDFFDKRTGPIVAVVTGSASKSDADSLLDSVNYEANVTWNERVPTKRDNIGSVVVASLALAGVLGAFALVFGIAFGGFRLLLKRLHPERGMAFSGETEFISLRLGEDEPRQPDRR